MVKGLSFNVTRSINVEMHTPSFCPDSKFVQVFLKNLSAADMMFLYKIQSSANRRHDDDKLTEMSFMYVKNSNGLIHFLEGHHWLH